MRNRKICKIFLALLLMAPVSAFAQIISVGAQVGWSVPKGEVFKYGDQKSAKGGLNVDADVLYHFSLLGGGRLAAGVTYNGSLLFGANVNNMDIGLYGLSLYGAKGYFKVLPGPISPYAALSIGVAHLSTPKMSSDDGTQVSKSKSANAFGLRPEIGIKLTNFTISAGYIVPTDYSFDSGTKNAGIFQISLGMRFGFL